MREKSEMGKGSVGKKWATNLKLALFIRPDQVFLAELKVRSGHHWRAIYLFTDVSFVWQIKENHGRKEKVIIYLRQ